VMVCVSEPTFPGCVIEVKPIALFRMEDDQGVDDKVLAVPCSDPTWNQLSTLDDLNQQLQDEIAHFFSVYKDLEQKKVTVHGWFSREDAVTEIKASRDRFSDDEHGPHTSNPTEAN
jgi:inorganic pyrophosphatase